MFLLQFCGVLQGALLSAFAATVGSSVAFALAKLDTPIRQKTLELIDKKTWEKDGKSHNPRCFVLVAFHCLGSRTSHTL